MDAAVVDAEQVKGMHGDHERKGRIQTAGQTDDCGFAARVLHTGCKTNCLHVQDFFAAGFQFVLIVRNERALRK